MLRRRHEEDSGFITTRQQVDEFERIVKQLDALHQEFVAQAKSKPDNPINKFKLKMLNEKIAIANRILGAGFKPFDAFTEFDETDLPTNSDVSLVLTTYLATLERWRSAHVQYDNIEHEWHWRTAEQPPIEASRPTRYEPREK